MTTMMMAMIMAILVWERHTSHATNTEVNYSIQAVREHLHSATNNLPLQQPCTAYTYMSQNAVLQAGKRTLLAYTASLPKSSFQSSFATVRQTHTVQQSDAQPPKLTASLTSLVHSLMHHTTIWLGNDVHYDITAPITPIRVTKLVQANPSE
ncbi:hypothetical protein V8C86DRAFT_785219 [Haematococcus lacustris]